MNAAGSLLGYTSATWNTHTVHKKFLDICLQSGGTWGNGTFFYIFLHKLKPIETNITNNTN